MVIVAAVVFIIISALIAQRIDFKMTKQDKQVLPSATPTNTPQPTPQPTSSKTNSPISIKQEIKDEGDSDQSINLSDFKYPQSTQISASNKSLKLESSDDVQIITDWYKEKIRSLGFKSKSFVQTNSNGNVLNKLVGALGKNQVRIEIEKKANEDKTSINIVITT